MKSPDRIFCLRLEIWDLWFSSWLCSGWSWASGRWLPADPIVAAPGAVICCQALLSHILTNTEWKKSCLWMTDFFFFFLINQFRWIQLLELESSCVCTVTCFLRDRSYGFVLWALCVIQEIMACCNVDDSAVCRVVPGYKTINGSCFRFMLWFFLAFPQKVHW